MACCEIYVNDDGIYCCNIDGFRVKPGCFMQIKSANLPPTPILMEVDTGTYVPSGIVTADPCTTIFKPGDYALDFDCATIHGTVAPLEGAISLCFECLCPKDASSILSMQLDALLEATSTATTDPAVLDCLAELKLLVAANNDATALATLIADLQAVCDKLLANGDTQVDILGSLQALCDKFEESNAAILECLEALKENTLADFKIIKESGIPGANYEGAFRYINGRPPASLPWALIDNRDPLNQVTVASGANLNAFVSDLESKGFTEWNTGEEHWICPCPPGLTVESTGAYFTTVDGETAVKHVCVPIAEVTDVPTDKIIDNTAMCALRTIGCNDDRRDKLLESMFGKMCELVDSVVCDVPLKSAVTYVNTDNETELVVSVGGSGDIKFDSGNGDSSDQFVVACIENALASGQPCSVSWTTVEGGSGSATLDPDAQTNAFPNFYNQTTSATGDSGKLQTLTCS